MPNLQELRQVKAKVKERAAWLIFDKINNLHSDPNKFYFDLHGQSKGMATKIVEKVVQEAIEKLRAKLLAPNCGVKYS